jgi:membrane fusion protein (multidrug efflux system)
MKHRYSYISGFLAAAALVIAGCAKDEPNVQRPSVEVGVVTLKAQSVALKAEVPGRTAASLVSDVRPQVSGIVKARRFDEGAQVKAGDVLYEIDPSSYQAAYNEAKADLENAEAAVGAAKAKNERYTELLKMDAVSKQDVDDAKAAYRQTVATVALKQAALETARINLGYTKVRAPISGRIGKSGVTPGALVTANQDTALATIRALDPMYVDLTQSSAQLLRLRKMLGTDGMQAGSTSVRLKLEDGSDYTVMGKLQFHEVSVDESTGSVTLRAEFPNPNGVLLPGMYVRAVLDEAVNTAAILVPQQGVARDPKGNASVMVVGKDNRIEQRAVVADRTIGDRWLISEGLSAGDQLVIEGLNKVRVGDTVRPITLTTDGTEADVRAASNIATPGSL